MKFLENEGRVGEAVRRKDWSDHPLGSPHSWSPALRSNLYTILNSVAPKMLLWGPELFVFYNDAIAALIDPADCPGLGSTYPEFRPEVWPRFRPCVEAGLAGTGSMLDDFTTRGLHAGADVDRAYQVSFSPVLDEHRSVAGVLIDALDITPRKRLEQHLRSQLALLNELFATAPVLIAYASGPEMRFDYVNAAFERLLGGRPLLGRTVADAVPEAMLDGYLPKLQEVLRTGEPWHGFDAPRTIFPARGGDPQTVYLDFVNQPIVSADGATTGILFSGYDVTERRRAREDSERLRHQLLHASHVSALGTMAVTIAHELNQPLTAGVNYLAAAEHFAAVEGTSERVRGPMTSAKAQLLRAGDIVRRMRSLVTCGKARLARFDLGESIDRAVELARASGNLEGFAVDTKLAADAPDAVGDDVQIEQVLANLLRNAAQASRGSTERRALVTAERDRNSLAVTVRDWGAGIPADRIASLFTAAQESGAGLGVGLSLCRTIIDAHGGTISGENHRDGGAVFKFTLPAAN